MGSVAVGLDKSTVVEIMRLTIKEIEKVFLQ